MGLGIPSQQQQQVQIQKESDLKRASQKLEDEGGGSIGPMDQSGDPSEQAEKLAIDIIADGDSAFAAALTANLGQFKAAMLGENPTAAEEVVVDLLASSWLQRQYLTRVFWTRVASDLGELAKAPGGERFLGLWVKILDIPMSRLNQSIRILGSMRENAAALIGPKGVAQAGDAAANERVKAEIKMQKLDDEVQKDNPIVSAGLAPAGNPAV